VTTTFNSSQELEFTLHDQLPADDAAAVDAGLGSYNEAAAPVHEVRPLACFARMPSGQLVGGAVGRTWGECCELQQLWVDADHRRRGIGGRLVREFERGALLRACRRVYLDTFSFQAPSLYRSLGYSVRLEIHGYAPGIVRYTMMRELVDESDR
jgi:ribosomal protein S18 acetylase RimI-like enzyme